MHERPYISSSSKTTSRGDRSLAAIILAAGKGTRMNSDLPKVVHPIVGRPMVNWVVDAVRHSNADPIVLVVGHGASEVRKLFQTTDDEDIRFVTQNEQLGTGHATLQAAPELESFDGDIVVLAGDGPLIRPATIEAMVDRHRYSDAAATIATSTLRNPTGYGRIVRDSNNRFQEIVEQKNATPEQLQIAEVYPSYACFDAQSLFESLRALKPNDVTGEYYITDLFAMLRNQGKTVEIVGAVPPEDVLSINTPEQLAEVNKVMLDRLQEVR